ncbi:hypothetical protein HYDPIDRAFT_119754 [Hydnomerulius pinastri MD-312]|uniref:Uncharacterized protein n=1 Tax=Hydnomerulius pinastri MD-312 TaxID=994086 RepID=A0A0C9W6B5_9AGAM|nr:hypothetical protein HYDPIDRAFT_119754 [Hydnomerulius pinastri MD-312]
MALYKATLPLQLGVIDPIFIHSLLRKISRASYWTACFLLQRARLLLASRTESDSSLVARLPQAALKPRGR